MLELRRLLSVTSLVPSFGDGGRVLTDTFGGVEEIADIVSATDGGYYAAFTSKPTLQNGPTDRRFGVAKFTAAGDFDSSFGSGGFVFQPMDTVFGVEPRLSIDVSSSGEIFVAGTITQGSPTSSDAFIAKLFGNGVFDSGFGGDGVATYDLDFLGQASTTAFEDVLLVGSGTPRVLIAGTYSVGGTPTAVALKLMSTNGSLDTSFSGDGVAMYSDVGNLPSSGARVVADGTSVVLAGRLTTSSSGGAVLLAKFDAAGVQTDGRAFFGGPQRPTGLVVDATNDRYVMLASGFSGATMFGFGRGDLSLDSNFGLSSSGLAVVSNGMSDLTASELLMGGDGNLYVVGSGRSQTDPDLDGFVGRFSASGLLDTSFGSMGYTADFGSETDRDFTVNSAAFGVGQGHGTPIVVLAGASVGDLYATGRLLSDGAADGSFNRRSSDREGAANEILETLVVSPTESYVLFRHFQGERFTSFELRRFDGVLSGDTGTTFARELMLPFAQFELSQLARDAATGQIYVVGTQTDTAFGSSVVVMRVDATTGNLDTSFAGSGFVTSSAIGNGRIFDAEVDASGRVVFAGSFSNETTFGVGRFDTNGNLDTTFNGGGIREIFGNVSGGAAKDIFIRTDGKILATGRISTSGGSDVATALLLPDGSLDSGFGAGAGKVVFDIDGSSLSDEAVAIIPESSTGAVVYLVATKDFEAIPAGRSSLVYRIDGNTGDFLAGDTQFGFGGGSGVGASFGFGLIQASGLVRPDGRLLIVGSTESTSGGADGQSVLVEYLPDGLLGSRYSDDGPLRLDTLYGFTSVRSLHVVGNDSVILAGTTRVPVGGLDGMVVNIVGEDMTAPFGSVVDSVVTVDSGTNSLTLNVQFGEDVLLPPNLTGNPSFLVVTAPDGTELARFDPNGPPALTLGFTFYRPNGVFDETDQGTYTVSFANQQFADSAGNFSSGVIGTFELNVNSPDLSFTSLSRTPEAVPVGGQLTITSTVQIANNSNITNNTNNGQYSIHYFLSTDTAFDPGSDLSIGTLDGLTTAGTNTSTYAVPTGAVAGTSYFILAIVDSGNGTVEENESNNTIVPGSARVFIATGTGVDVLLSNVQLSGSSVQVGQSVSITGQAKNHGTAGSLAGTAEYYLSADSMFDGGDILLTSEPVDPLAAATQTNISESADFVSVGSFFVLARYVNNASETDINPANNVVALPITVTAAPVDLVAQSVTLSLTSVRAGVGLPASVQVANSRMGSTVSGFDVFVFLSSDSTLDSGDTGLGSFISSASVGGFGATDVNLSSLVIPGNLTPGSYFVIAVLDLSGSIGETDESNNVAVSTAPLQVQEAALTVTPNSNSQALLNALLASNSGITVRSVSVSSRSSDPALSVGTFVNPGGVYGIGSGIVLSNGNVGQLNSGSSAVELSTDYEIAATTDEEALLDQITGGSLNHFDVTRIDLVVDLASGLDSIFFNVVFGSDEFPDFLTSSFVDAFGLFINGLNVATTGGSPLTIKTPGFAATDGTGLNGVLAPNGQAVLRFGSFVGAGATNVTLTFIIADTVDSSVDSAAFISGLTASANPGVPVANPTLTDVVAGTGGSTYSFAVTYTDDTGIDQATLDGSDIRVRGPNNFEAAATLLSLTGGAAGTIVATYQFAAPGGSFDLADIGQYQLVLQPGQVQDSGGTFVPAGVIGSFAVVAPATGTDPDLIVTSLVVNVGEYAPSQPIFFAATVTNAGTAAAGAFVVTFALSTDGVFGPEDVVILNVPVESLAGSGLQSLTNLSSVVPAGLALGNYFLLVIADGTSLIVESNENNNTARTEGAGVEVALPVPETPVPQKTGGLDTNFGVQGVVTNVFVDKATFTTTDVRRAPDGKLVAVGVTTEGAGDFVVTRFNLDGTIDTTFGNSGLLITDLGFADRPNTIQIDSQGRYVVGGFVDRTVSGGTDRDIAIARYLPSGVLDSSFGTGGFVVIDLAAVLGAAEADELIEAITFDANGRIVLAGSVSVNGGNTDMLVGRLTEAGAADTSFGGSGFVVAQFGPGADAALGVTVDRQGRVITAGYAATTGAVSAMAAARFKADGTADGSFGTAGRLVARVSITDSRAYALGVRPDGGLYLGGYSARGPVSSANFDADFAILSVNPRGQIDRSFGGGLVTTDFDGFLAAVTDLVVQDDGRVVASGKIASGLGAVSEPLLGVATARYTTKGDLDPTFGTNGISIIFAAAGEVISGARAGRDDPTLSAQFDTFIESRRGKIESATGGRIQALSDGVTPDGDTRVQIAQVLGDAADLVGVIVTKLPASVRSGVSSSGTVTVTNAGSLAASGRINIPIYLSSDAVVDESDVLLTTLTDQRISLNMSRSRGFSFKFVIPVDLASGQYFILADIDAGRVIKENNIANNVTSSAPVAVSQAFVDLSPIFSTTPSSLQAGRRGTFSVNLTNNGNSVARGTATVRIFRSGDGVLGGDDELLGTANVSVNLQPGRSRNSRVSFTLPEGLTAGQFNLVVVVEFAGDANAGNNSAFSAAPVTFTAA
jgi:uncharacterized delta-60 repeat protein